jgi:sugar lactone lactonase YvrE
VVFRQGHGKAHTNGGNIQAVIAPTGSHYGSPTPSPARCTTSPPPAPEPGIIALVTPDGSARQVADDVAFPNGMVVTPDNSTPIIAESFASRLTAFGIDADGSLPNRRV